MQSSANCALHLREARTKFGSFISSWYDTSASRRRLSSSALVSRWPCTNFLAYASGPGGTGHCPWSSICERYPSVGGAACEPKATGTGRLHSSYSRGEAPSEV
eukprot:CAMPEP_0205882320 /NCGR_PEP_ID=MMETSP1083-20121108/16933_1 /ASSEMBLY_ACC=CAM_ASM_000430 /TAXON_ID=97485 /ORGANISM="Prymnesium parvum, Strain Texoma1" /LENGTH=102 /DNA_ID=CAMNT_0053245469 /DNA_START=1189 /DNA_END=1494 /DNA_ORIENTATION=+